MNFLPFVFTFLLLLTLISSFLFSSVMGTARESKVIVSHHRAYSKLISDQNSTSFKKKTKDGPNHPKKEHHPPGSHDPEPRSTNEGLEMGKLNLFAMIHGNNPQVQEVLAQAAAQLLDILYGKCAFYNKPFCKTMIAQMIDQKIESFEELKLENDKDYYKMLKGTNTGYPALGEYFRIEKKTAKPIYFRWATKPVLRAVLGEELAKTVFDSEREKWLQDKSKKVMIRKDFEDLLKSNNSSLLTYGLLGEMMDFDNKKKGSPQIHQEGKEKIRAMHQVEEPL